eukprot:365272-Chlamydomonas_euryale.AAC.5
MQACAAWTPASVAQPLPLPPPPLPRMRPRPTCSGSRCPRLASASSRSSKQLTTVWTSAMRGGPMRPTPGRSSTAAPQLSPAARMWRCNGRQSMKMWRRQRLADG